MGSRGQTSGANKAQKSNNGKWDYRTITGMRSSLENALDDFKKNKNRYKSIGFNQKITSLIKRTESAVKIIDAELKTPTIDGDTTVLYTERRKLQTLKRKIVEFGKSN